MRTTSSDSTERLGQIFNGGSSLLNYGMVQHSAPVGAPDVVMVSDAFGSWGCGAFTETRWFQVQWPANFVGQSITFKELFPIVLALVVWGRQWRGNHLHCRCHNQAVYSSHPSIMEFPQF